MFYLRLPLFYELELEQVRMVVSAVNCFYGPPLLTDYRGHALRC
jgi:hypothetical protein